MYTKDKVRTTKPKDGETAHFDLLTATTLCWQTRVDAIAIKNNDTSAYDSDITAKLRELQANQFMF